MGHCPIIVARPSWLHVFFLVLPIITMAHHNGQLIWSLLKDSNAVRGNSDERVLLDGQHCHALAGTVRCQATVKVRAMMLMRLRHNLGSAQPLSDTG